MQNAPILIPHIALLTKFKCKNAAPVVENQETALVNRVQG